MREARDRSRQPEIDIGNASGRGGQERHSPHTITEEFRTLIRQRHDRHAPHGVPDEHDQPHRRHRVEDATEIPAESLDGRAGSAALRATVPPLVPEHHARHPAQGLPLSRPGIE